MLNIYTATPNVSITWIELHEDMVVLSWEHYDGYILGVRLGHRYSVASFPDTGNQRNVSEQPTGWNIIRDNIGAEESNLFVRNVAFSLHVYNAFALFPFEDEYLKSSGDLYGQSDEIIIRPLPAGKYVVTFSEFPHIT